MIDGHRNRGSKLRGLIVFWALNGFVVVALLVFAAR
jgi:hypothetical protein